MIYHAHQFTFIFLIFFVCSMW